MGSPQSRLEALLKELRLDLSAAEVHGFMVGRLCTDHRLPWEAIAEELLPEDLPLSCRKRLKALTEEVCRELLATDFSFNLWLPPEERPLPERAVALAEWCQGLLYGIGLGGRIAWSKEAEEILADVQKIATLDPDASGEEDERAFVELVEYLRTAVQLLVEEALSRHHAGA